MLVVENFLAAGTQLRLELPGKGGVTVPVDSLEPPVVALKDGSVVRVSLENFSQIKGKIEKILFLGDILISYGDFLYTSKALSPSGYVEEWWAKDLKKLLIERFGADLEKAAKSAGISHGTIESFLESILLTKNRRLEEAIAMSQHLSVPLHPASRFSGQTCRP